MRLSSELLRTAPAYMNPIRERELNLRGFKIPAIENLGVVQDHFDTIDFSDNEISKMDNFPMMAKLRTIIANNNRISHIASGLGQYLPRLSTLVLTGNKLTEFSQLDPLAEFKKLTHLSLMRNPVAKKKNYRLHVIHRIPTLKVLDYAKIKQKERDEAKEKFGEKFEKGKKKESDAKDVYEPMDEDKDEKQVRKIGDRVLTLELSKKIEDAIQNATSLAEIERLEKMLSSGVVDMDL